MHKERELTKRAIQKNGASPVPCQVLFSNGTVKKQAKEEIVQPSEEEVEVPTVGPEITPTRKMNILPESSVWCTGTSHNDRTCRFRNLCYTAKHEQWFILKTNRTIQEGVPKAHRYKGPFLETSSIDNHPFFGWNYLEVDPFLDEFKNITVRYEELTHFLFKRLHPRNIMHNLHDDVLNLYYLIKKYNGKATEPGRMVLPFSLFAHRIMMLDPYEGTDSTRPFQYLSNHPLRFFSYVTNKDGPNDVTCFRDAIIGSSTVTKWYQYGFFKEPQGPLPSLPNGNHVREVAEWIAKRMLLPLGFDEHYPTLPPPPLGPAKLDNSHYDFPETNLIIILSRKANRLMLNEEELATQLTATFGYETKFVRNEDHSFEEQIKILRRARIVVGMHGSILVMAMFCRRGTVFIEMFPFAVPSEHYTPYKTMSNLPGMDLVYTAWEVISIY
jgi:protein O-mannose beta-1,4-N-acetylglucosaminyltransferase